MEILGYAHVCQIGVCFSVIFFFAFFFLNGIRSNAIAPTPMSERATAPETFIAFSRIFLPAPDFILNQ